MTAEVPRAEDIEALVEAFQQSGCAELHVRFDGFELHLASEAPDAAAETPAAPRPPAPAPAPESHAPAARLATPAPAASAQAAAPAASLEDLEGFTIVRAPYLGIFYRAPKPGDPPYVELGQAVAPETDVCLVEVMKLFTAVRAGTAGTLAKVLAADGAMVEAGQPLFAIAPEA